VVTPPGETPMAPGWAGSAGRGGNSLVGVVGGGVDVDDFCSCDEHAATVSISSAVNSPTCWAYLRMPTNVCNACMQRVGPVSEGVRSRVAAG